MRSIRGCVIVALLSVVAACTATSQSEAAGMSEPPIPAPLPLPLQPVTDAFVGDVLRMPLAESDDKAVVVAANTQEFAQLGPLYFGRAGFVDLEGRYGYVNARREIVIEPNFEWGGDFSRDLAPVRTKAGLRFVGRDGRLRGPVIEADRIGPLRDGLSWIERDGRFGFVNAAGRVVIEPKFELVHDFSQGLAVARRGGMYGFIDKQGRFVVSPQFRQAGEFRAGVAWVQFENGKYSFVRSGGGLWLDRQFDSVLPFAGGRAAVALDDGFGFVDQSGEVGPASFDSVLYYDRDRAVGFRGGQLRTLRSDGREIDMLADGFEEVVFESTPPRAKVYRPSVWEYEHAPSVEALLIPRHQVPEGSTKVATRLRGGARYKAIFVLDGRREEREFKPGVHDRVAVEFE